MVRFGIEYETCVITNKSKSWGESLTRYTYRLHEVFKKDDTLEPWATEFDNTILILDDDSKVHSYNIMNNTYERDIDLGKTKEYKYPLLTIDSTVKCHLTLPNESKHAEYMLPADKYTINMEIVSHIMYSIGELDNFFKLFITPFVASGEFVHNKSQGVHVTTDISEYDDETLRETLIEKYIPWEKKALLNGVRTTPSMWAIPLNEGKLSTNNLEGILGKTSSVRFKKSDKLLEFRLLTPSTPTLFDHILELLKIINPAISGGSRSRKTKTRKGKRIGQKKRTQKIKRVRMPLVFVYGSLRKGLANHTKLHDAVYKGQFRTKDEYYMIGLKSKAYPYVTSEKLDESLTRTHITGELYEVSEDLLAELDILEGHPTNYTRTLVALGPFVKAWMYLLTNKDIQTGIARSFERRFVDVPTGDWVVHLDSCGHLCAA